MFRVRALPLLSQSRRALSFYRQTSMTPVEQLPKIYPALALHPTVQEFVDIQTTKDALKQSGHWKRNTPRNCKPQAMKHDFTDATYGKLMSEQEALQEASRCLKCADAPCQKGCPTRVNIKFFIQQIQAKNYYGAAKTILSSNPLGMSCGLVCATSDLCAGNCNLANSHDGPIDIGALQYFAIKRYRDMQVKPSRPEVKFNQKIALVGAGPASLSCATYLARLGYGDITIFEKAPYAGGISAAQIPNFRLPQEAVNFEVEQLKDLGVRIQYNKALGSSELPSVEALRQKYDAVFLGVGLQSPISDKALGGVGAKEGYFNSRDFLTAVAEASKADLPVGQRPAMPKLHGRVAVLGCGDTALDCARTAYRLGAEKVTLVFFEDSLNVKANKEELDQALLERVELMPCSLTKRVMTKNGHICGLQLYHTDGQYTKKEGDEFAMPCDFVISAFGSRVDPVLAKALPATITLDKSGVIPVAGYGATDMAGVFAGGDLIGSHRTVEAVNDGRTAAYGIHQYLQAQANNTSVSTEVPTLPGYQTEVDNVDISVNMCGIKFPNPFGLASAPGANSLEMMRRALHAGWGFVVLKTFTKDEDVVTNISPRIMSSMQAGQKAAHYQGGFMNIELIGEKYEAYWLNAIRKLKQEFPEKVVVGSIMAAHKEADWQYLAKKVEQAGADAIELNLSCPHGMHEKGMGLAIGTRTDWVEDVCRWVRKGTELPFFAKLTPNVTDISAIAEAAMKGGANGVTAINTVSGLVGIHFDATPFRQGVGKARNSTYGGLCGNMVRPLGLKAVSAISRRLPGTPIMGVGGVDSADIALQFIYAGASVVQVSSAIMNQEYTIVNDYINGLKTLLYLRSRKDLAAYDFQSAPEKGRRVPSFGPFEQEFRDKQAATRAIDLTPSARLPSPVMGPLPKLNDLVGAGLSHITDHHKLLREEQIVMQVNQDLCLRCGKCMMACNDSGYMAFQLDAKTHLPTIDEAKCTGCGLCESVCPSNGCITHKDRGHYQAPERGKSGSVH